MYVNGMRDNSRAYKEIGIETYNCKINIEIKYNIRGGPNLQHPRPRESTWFTTINVQNSKFWDCASFHSSGGSYVCSSHLSIKLRVHSLYLPSAPFSPWNIRVAYEHQVPFFYRLRSLAPFYSASQCRKIFSNPPVPKTIPQLTSDAPLLAWHTSFFQVGVYYRSVCYICGSQNEIIRSYRLLLVRVDGQMR